jgi:hypothetical protein
MQIIDLGNGAEYKVDEYGTKWWYLNGKLHRSDGPAIEFSEGDTIWYLNDRLHRTDGPAIEHNDGNKWWCINGVFYSEEDFDIIKEMLWAI